jgi:poly-gamma-glutamate capsule biosynthesis protein CapA/YwtB (metallophosphatase superfamily)
MRTLPSGRRRLPPTTRAVVRLLVVLLAVGVWIATTTPHRSQPQPPTTASRQAPAPTSVGARAAAARARPAVRQPSAAAETRPAPATSAGRVAAPAESRPRAEPSRRVATPRPRPPTGFTLMASGDVLAHGSVVARAGAYGGRSGRRFDFRPMFASVRPLVSAADLAVCHLETPLSPSGRRLSGYPRFNAPPQLAAAIHHAGYDACSVASNHAMDQGVRGVAGTLAVLDRAGLRHAGTARSPREARPRILTVHRVRVALLSYTYGLNGFRLPPGRPWLVNLLGPGRVLADARAARRAGSQFTVVFLHWGQEYRSAPTPAQRRLARRLLADPSVDLLVGHHAHVVQPIERSHGKWVAFGLGNSLSAQSAACCPAATQDGVLLQATIVAKAGRMVVARLRYVPTWVEHPSYRILPVARALARGSASPATRAMLRASLHRTTAAVGHATRPAT